MESRTLTCEDVCQWRLAQASAAAIYGVYRAVLPPLSPVLAMQVRYFVHRMHTMVRYFVHRMHTMVRYFVRRMHTMVRYFVHRRV